MNEVKQSVLEVLERNARPMTTAEIRRELNFDISSNKLGRQLMDLVREGILLKVQGRYLKPPTTFYECPICGERFLEFERLRTHFGVKHASNGYCWICRQEMKKVFLHLQFASKRDEEHKIAYGLTVRGWKLDVWAEECVRYAEMKTKRRG